VLPQLSLYVISSFVRTRAYSILLSTFEKISK
jgi:hypothetical protein